MKQIIVVKPNSVSAENKKMLQEENCILIEHEKPSEVRVICLAEGLEGDDLFNSLIESILKSNYSTQQDFTNKLLTKILNRKK